MLAIAQLPKQIGSPVFDKRTDDTTYDPACNSYGPEVPLLRHMNSPYETKSRTLTRLRRLARTAPLCYDGFCQTVRVGLVVPWMLLIRRASHSVFIIAQEHEKGNLHFGGFSWAARMSAAAGSPSGVANAVLLLSQPSRCWLARCADLQYNPVGDVLLGLNLHLLGVLYYVMKGGGKLHRGVGVKARPERSG